MHHGGLPKVRLTGGGGIYEEGDIDLLSAEDSEGMCLVQMECLN